MQKSLKSGVGAIDIGYIRAIQNRNQKEKRLKYL